MSALSFGQQVHYTSKEYPYIESPAIVIMRSSDFIGTTADGRPVDDEYHVHLKVFGLHNDYREFNVPEAGGVSDPGTWHFDDEMNRCTVILDLTL